MAFVSKISNLLSAVAIKEPTGVWEKIIMAFHNGIPNYAWAIIIFTLVLKIVMLPLDFFNRRMTVKNTKVQSLVQPEVEKIQKKYGNNKQMINQKTMEIYKKYNYNVTGSCVLMLVYMGLTLFIFITLFSGLNSMAAYKVGFQYQEMEKTYNQAVIDSGYQDYIDAYDAQYKIIYDTAFSSAYSVAKNNLMTEKGYFSEEELTEEDLTSLNATAKTTALEEVSKEENLEIMINAGQAAVGGKELQTLTDEINTAVVETYKNVKNSWLWIDNVWKSDVPWKKSATSFNEFVTLARITYKDSLNEGQEETFNIRLSSNKESDKETYENVMNAIESENRVNGYLIIPILAVIVNVLSLLATQGKLKLPRKKKKELEAIQEPPKKQPGGLIMLILIPVLMGYITISYNAVFGLYILMSSLVGLATTPLINFGIKKMDNFSEKRKAKKGNNNDLSYKR